MTVAEPIQSYNDGGPYSLDKLKLAEAHVVNGREFPVAYQLNIHGNAFDAAKVESLLANFSKSGNFTKLLEDHGAVVLRDFVENPDTSKSSYLADLIKIVEENRGFVEFEQNGTRTLRTKVGHNLYIANDRVPQDVRILQHNEYSRFKTWPTTINFTIPEYTATGGETPIVHGGELFQRVSKELPDLLSRLSKYGLQFKDELWPFEESSSAGVVWNHEVTFGRFIKPEDDLATQKAKAEEISKKYISDNIKWAENNDLVISSLARPVKQFKGEPILFSSLAAYADEYGSKASKDPKIRYGNGELFDTEDLTKYKDIVSDVEYNHSWKSGDLVFIHNFQVSHGKLPYKDGKRQILVGMWDEKIPERRKLFVDYAV